MATRKKKGTRGRKNTPKKTPRKKTGSKRSGRALQTASFNQLQAEIRRRERQRARRLTAFTDRRKRLLAQLKDLDAQIAALGGSASPRNVVSHGQNRLRNPVVLVDALKRVLDHKTLSVSDAAGAVRRGGYRTTSDNFRTIVNQTLLGNRKTFKKVSRGMYTAKKG